MAKSRTVGLVACTSRKRKHPTVAEYMYDSPLFKGASHYSKTRCDSWYILSAKHGLTSPSERIDPYDESLVGADVAKRRNWAESVFSQLVPRIASNDRIIFLAGKPYREFLEPMLIERGNQTAAPLSGLGIGSQASWLLKITQENKRLAHLDRLYFLLARLREKLGGARKLGESTGKDRWPQRGIYLFFEPNEYRMSAPFEHRITRVGTHSVSQGSKTTLWHRLRTHRGSVEDGSGNHRGSIFRLHVGKALIKKHALTKSSSTWGEGQSASPAIRASEVELERLVSKTIADMSLLWLTVQDAASPQSDRAYLERNIIGLLAGPYGPIDLPSSKWLGRCSSKSAICSSGLWNINYVDYPYDARVLDIIEQYIDITIGASPPPRGSLAPRNWYSESRRLSGVKQLSLI